MNIVLAILTNCVGNKPTTVSLYQCYALLHSKAHHHNCLAQKAQANTDAAEHDDDYEHPGHAALDVRPLQEGVP